MVSDSKATDGVVKWPCKKIERIGDSLFGFAGEVTDIEKMTRWFRGGQKGKRPRTKDFVGLELTAEGVFIWDDAPCSYRPDREFHAIGSGQMAALGALLAGKSAVEAVEIAVQIDHCSEPPVQVVRLHG